MIKYGTIVLLLLLVISCKKEYTAPVPDVTWPLFDSSGTAPLTSMTRQKIEGVYAITEGSDAFGESSVMKCSYTANGSDTTYHFSLFCQKEVIYIICEGKRLDSNILLNGYWRNMVNTETGKIRLTITNSNGASQLLNSTIADSVSGVTVTGVYGSGDNPPDKNIVLSHLRKLRTTPTLQIVAHRGGGRTSDLLPASENTVEVIKLASRFGATGIEIDARMTKDGVLILYHDETLNDRLIKKNGLVGPIENYTYDQLYNLVRLKNGEHIPTLRQALNTVLYNTPLRYVWLDTKLSGSLQKLIDMQKEYLQLASAMGRSLEITIGIPDNEVLQNFQALPDFTNVPSVCELTPQNVATVNARIWAPRFTLGLQGADVQNMHAQSRRVYVWTLDVPDNIKKYMNEGEFDGILSNYPSAVAYFYYAKQ